MGKQTIKVKESAPGKLMLVGEHAVVYGFPCIVKAINKKISVTAEFTTNSSVNFPSGSDYVKTAIKIFSQKYDTDLDGLSLTTDSEFNSVLGLGSSSAVTIATLKALSKIFRINLKDQQLFDLSLEAVRRIYPRASGFDLAAAVFGGTIFYKIGMPVQILPDRHIPLLVVYSGTKASTDKIVNYVAELKKNSPSKVKGIFIQIEDLINEAKTALIEKNWHLLGKLFNDNHNLLVELGVSTEKLDRLQKVAIKEGALGAKLSGAGGGDCLIVLHDKENKTLLQKILAAQGGQILEVF